MAAQLYAFEKALRRTDVEVLPPTPERELTASTGVTSQMAVPEQFKETASALLLAFEEAKAPRSEGVGIFRINMLPNKEVRMPIDAILERDGEGFVARTIELPLYGYGLDPIDAINMLKDEIESLYNDLMEDDDYTDDWPKVKEYLRSRVSDS
jgi:hypothetical protein